MSAKIQRLSNTACCSHHRISAIYDLNAVLVRQIGKFPSIQFQRAGLLHHTFLPPVFPALLIESVDIVIEDQVSCPLLVSYIFVFLQITDHITIRSQIPPVRQLFLIPCSCYFSENSRQHHISFQFCTVNLSNQTFQILLQTLRIQINSSKRRSYPLCLSACLTPPAEHFC